MPGRSSLSYEQACIGLACGLRQHFLEIEAAIHVRIREKTPVDPDPDPEYIHGLHEAIRSAIEYTLTSIETGESKAPPIPISLLGQARIAARHGVSLGTVLRRYTLGAHQISNLIVAEARNDPRLLDDHLQQLLREQTIVLERVLLELEHEYNREQRCSRPDSLHSRRAELVKRRLAGDPVDTSTLNYQFDSRHHIGLVSQGDDSNAVLNELAEAVDGRLLRIEPGGDSIWAWIGTRHRIDLDRIQRHRILDPARSARLGFGEPGSGAYGWGQTHRQAVEAFRYVLRNEAFSVRYADIALQAAIEKHDLATTSLHQLYIAPLESRTDGAVLLNTLRAYFAAGRNAAATEAELAVSRQTVSKRLRSIESHLRRPLDNCWPELEVALRLREFRDQLGQEFSPNQRFPKSE